MSFATLLEHDSIGWDADGTLLDHPRAPAMHEFIRRTPEKRHVIVTFRSHGMERRIWTDLFRETDLLGRDDFDSVVNMSDEMFEREYLSSRTPAGLFIPTRRYIEWKGEVCAHLGLTVLVDDATDQVLPGCERYGIIHIHPDDL